MPQFASGKSGQDIYYFFRNVSENLELSQCIAVITFTMNPCFLMFSAFVLFSNRIRKSKIEFRKSTRAGKSVEERTVARKGC